MRNIKRIAVTGAAGFIGSHLVELLLERSDIELVLGLDTLTLGSRDNLENALNDKRYICRKMDLRKYEELCQVLERHRIEAVLHLATTPLVFSLKSPRESSSGIFDMQLTLLEALRAGHFGYLLSFSTSEVYGSSPALSLDEESRVLPRTAYAAGKAAGDMLALAYNASYNLDVTIIRPFNNYGPRKRVLPGAGIIPTTIKKIANRLPVEIFGDGSASRDFVYVTDTAKAVIAAAFSASSKGHIFNVATGVTRSVIDVVQDIARNMNTEAEIVFRPDRTADVSALRGNGDKMFKILGFKPQMDWNEGLKNCIDYYIRVTD